MCIFAVHNTSCINRERYLLPLITNCNYCAPFLHNCRVSQALGLGALQAGPWGHHGRAPRPRPRPCGGPRAAPCCCVARTGGGSIARGMAAAAEARAGGTRKARQRYQIPFTVPLRGLLFGALGRTFTAFPFRGRV